MKDLVIALLSCVVLLMRKNPLRFHLLAV